LKKNLIFSFLGPISLGPFLLLFPGLSQASLSFFPCAAISFFFFFYANRFPHPFPPPRYNNILPFGLFFFRHSALLISFSSFSMRGVFLISFCAPFFFSPQHGPFFFQKNDLGCLFPPKCGRLNLIVSSSAGPVPLGALSVPFASFSFSARKGRPWASSLPGKLTLLFAAVFSPPLSSHRGPGSSFYGKDFPPGRGITPPTPFLCSTRNSLSFL